MTATTPASPARLAVLTMLQEGRFSEIRDLFAPSLRPMVAPEALKAAWEGVISEYGPFSSAGQPVTEASGGGAAALVKIPVSFARGEGTVILATDSAGMLAGLQLAPASAAEPTVPWQAPAYVDTAAFGEQDVILGEGPLAVPGTLSLPREGSPHSAVVLLGGSGPGDRDETFGRNKPFKDLAWGLASRGVAVLRFDKVTHAHPEQVRQDRGFTATAEYVPAAAAAIGLLQRTPGIDPGRVFVLGHSEGGTMAPRVAAAGAPAAGPPVAGLVIMAGGFQPLHWAAVRQLRYIASLNPGQAAASGPAIEAITRQAEMVDSPDLSRETPDSELPFGAPAAYWLDLRGYDPAATAAALGKPVLVLQGGRDYQATVEDDLPGWRAGLAGQPSVTIRVYDPDNHLFFPGSGPSTPAEYEPVQHMDPAVVADIADWLTQPRAQHQLGLRPASRLS